MLTPAQLIQQYGLLPHPEGGFYKETYRSSETIAANALPARFTGSRSFATAIYFLLEQGNFSGFHKIKSDEGWHFYAGGPLHVYTLHFDGSLETTVLGNDISAGQTFQHVVPANCWFASRPAPGTDFAFVGCTVAPGFDFADFELAKAQELIRLYPQHEELIVQLCRL